MKLEPDRVGLHGPARQTRPLDRVLTLFDPLLRRAPSIVEGHHALGWTTQVRDQEAHPGIEFAGVPLHLSHNPTCAAPSLGLIAEAGVEAPDLVRRTPHRTLEQISDPALQDSIGGQADHTLGTATFHGSNEEARL